jgi:hypothetical protein
VGVHPQLFSTFTLYDTRILADLLVGVHPRDAFKDLLRHDTKNLHEVV